MKQILRYVALSLLLVLATETTLAQQPQFREQHKVKRKGDHLRNLPYVWHHYSRTDCCQP